VAAQRERNVTYARLRSFLTGIRLLIPTREPLPCEVRHVREREEYEKRDKSPRVHESQVAFASLLQVASFISRANIENPNDKFIRIRERHVRPYEQYYRRADLPHDSWDKLLLPVRRIPRGPDPLRYVLFLDRRPLFHDANASFALSRTLSRSCRYLNITITITDDSLFECILN